MDSSQEYLNYFKDRVKKNENFADFDLQQLDLTDDILNSISEEIVIKYHLLPLDIIDKRLYAATDSIETIKSKSQLEGDIGYKVKLHLVSEEKLKLAVLKFYNIHNLNSGRLRSQTMEEDMTPLKMAILAMLQDAAKKKASDIHLLPQLNGYRVVFRVNGHPYDMSSEHNFTATHNSNIANLIKQLDTSGSADITRTNMPNEGAFYITHGGQDIFVRLETIPEGTGTGNDNQEALFLRLNPQASKTAGKQRRLEDLGYTDDDLVAIKETLYRNPTGLFLISGPTGSGKTTTLHADIHFVLDSRQEPLNVIEIAEPIEIYEDDFTQVQTRKANNEANNLPAEKILEASLRADPDIILFNEIRNSYDATVAIQASNTGHLVFSTVHAADCARTILRLLDFDISKTTLLAETKMIRSQRLVATLCPHCRKPHTLTDQEISALNPSEISAIANSNFEKGQASCPYCNNGYSGRTAIVEYVIFNTEIRDTLLHNNSFSSIQQVLKKHGFKSMWAKGIELVKSGTISVEDLINTVGREEK